MAEVADRVRAECENLGEKADEVWRRAAKMTEEVGHLKGAAQEAWNSASDAAGRTLDDTVDTVRRRARNLRHVPDDVAYQVRQSPLRAVSGALVVGVLAGVAFGWLLTRAGRVPPSGE